MRGERVDDHQGEADKCEPEKEFSPPFTILPESEAERISIKHANQERPAVGEREKNHRSYNEEHRVKGAAPHRCGNHPCDD